MPTSVITSVDKKLSIQLNWHEGRVKQLTGQIGRPNGPAGP